MTMQCVRWADQPVEATADGVRRALVHGAGADVKRIDIPADTRAGRHTHPFEQFVLVESGSGTLTTAQGTVRLEPGVVIHFPPETWHEAHFETATVLLEVNLRPPAAAAD